MWEITSDYPQARLTVGSDPSAGWPIEAPGVKGVHCELFWDGQSLWVADPAGVGGVFLDGQRVGAEWAQVQGPAEIRFGQAAMDVETSVPANQRMQALPDLAENISLLSEDGEGNAFGGEKTKAIAFFGGAAGDENVAMIEASSPAISAPGDQAATRLVALPETGAPRPGASAPGASGPGAQGGEGGFDLRPRLGGVAPSGAPAGGVQEATRMVALPVAPSSASGAFGGARPPGPAAAQSGAQPHVQSGAHAPPPVDGAAPISATHHLGPGEFLEPPGPGEAAPAPEGTPEKKTGFAGFLEKLKPEQPKTTGKQSVPTRTWILVGVTVVAALGLLLWEEDPVEEPTQPPTAVVVPANGQPATQAGTQQGSQGGQEASQGTPEGSQAAGGGEGEGGQEGGQEGGEGTPEGQEGGQEGGEGGSQTGSQATANANSTQAGQTQAGQTQTGQTQTGQTQAGQGGEEGEEGEEGENAAPSEERHAADLAIGGRYDEAIPAYQALAEAHPDRPEFASMVTILQQKLAARCRNGVGPGGQPCTQP